MRDKMLIVFLRAPERGRVKTRLAATVGEQRALEIYEGLVAHTLDQALPVECVKEAWYADVVPLMDRTAATGFIAKEQLGDDLGARMAYAFERAFNNGHSRVVIIGTDCPGLTTEMIQQAFMELEQNDAVLGPAQDGGYYLLGLRNRTESLFTNKTWSSDTVLQDTIADLERLGRSYVQLPVLVDVDTEGDLALVDLS